MKLFDVTNIPLLGRALDAYALRHRAIAANIANIGTPGYAPRTVSFEDELAAAGRGGSLSVATTDERHIASGAQSPADVVAEVRESPPGGPGDPKASGVNNVDLDGQMADLAENQIRFRFAARLMAGTFKDIQESIRGSE